MKNLFSKLALGAIAAGIVWFATDTDRSLYGLLPDRTEPAIFVDDKGRIAFDVSYSGKDNLFSTRIFGGELSGALIIDERGYGVGLKDGQKLDYLAIRQDLYVFGTYLIVAQTDRDISGMVAFEYDIINGFSKDDIDGGMRDCANRIWKRMRASGCVTVHWKDDLFTVTDPYLEVKWPADRNGFMRAADFVPLVTALCESGQYVVVDGACPVDESAFDVTLRPTYPNPRFSKVRFWIQPDGKRALRLEPNIRPTESDPSKLTVFRKDSHGDWRALSEEEKQGLLNGGG